MFKVKQIIQTKQSSRVHPDDTTFVYNCSFWCIRLTLWRLLDVLLLWWANEKQQLCLSCNITYHRITNYIHIPSFIYTVRLSYKIAWSYWCIRLTHRSLEDLLEHSCTNRKQEVCSHIAITYAIVMNRMQGPQSYRVYRPVSSTCATCSCPTEKYHPKNISRNRHHQLPRGSLIEPTCVDHNAKRQNDQNNRIHFCDSWTRGLKNKN